MTPQPRKPGDLCPWCRQGQIKPHCPSRTCDRLSCPACKWTGSTDGRREINPA